MAGSSSFAVMLSIVAFLIAAWAATRVSRLVGISPIPLEIATGVALGPSIFKVVAPEYTQCLRARHVDCSAPPNFAELLALGLPLGEGLGMIANKPGACPLDAYPSLSEDPFRSPATSGAAGKPDEGPTAEYYNETDNETLNGTAEDVAEAEEDAEEEAHRHQAPCDKAGVPGRPLEEYHPGARAGVEEGPDEHGKMRPRRLAGQKYASYEECLVKNCEAEIKRQCDASPDFFTLIGHAGVAMMLFESGVHFDADRAGAVGGHACAVAVMGIILPVVSGTMLMLAFGKPLMPDALAVGAALAPTSVGVALRLLGEAKVLQEEFGQIILTAAFIGDTLSLMLCNFLFNLASEDGLDIMDVVVLPLLGVVFMFVALILAVKFWPRVINQLLLPNVPVSYDSKISRRDEALFLLMVIVLVGYATATHFLGTHLWGCFLAGVSFSCLGKEHRPHYVWVVQTKRATAWMVRIFFAATVAFSIPVATLLHAEAFFRGTLLGLGPCILSKVCSAPFVGKPRFVVGWALVGRAELSYMVAQMASAAGILDDDTFAVLLWALLSATLLAPIVFTRVLDGYVRANYAEFKRPPITDADRFDMDLLAERR